MWIIRIKNSFERIQLGNSWKQKSHKNEIFDMFAFSLLRWRLCGAGCLAWHNTRGLPQPHNAPHCEKLWGFKWTLTLHSTLHVYTTGCVLTLPFPWRLREGFNLRKIKVLIFSFCCTDFAGAKYALCPPDPSLCTAANWQFIWEMWQIYLGAKHLLRLYICRVKMPENKGNWMELYL